MGTTTSRMMSKLLAKRKPNEDYDDTIYGAFEEGDIGMSRRNTKDQKDAFFSLYYRIYNGNRHNSASGKTPLVVLHGGPSLPSQYLYPMVPHLEADRSIIVYDQLGCGKSDEPREKGYYSISKSVKDLEVVLETLVGSSSRVHLLGHSFGGVIAYEFARQSPDQLQSLLLCNSPTRMKVAYDAWDRLALENPRTFMKRHVCSVEDPALEDALLNAGKVWSGMDVVLDYVALPSEKKLPKTLVLSCTKDFGFESSQDWRRVLGADTVVEEVCLKNCAHYPHLEDGVTFGRFVEDFMSRNDA